MDNKITYRINTQTNKVMPTKENAILLAEYSPVRTAKLTSKSYIIGFEREDGTKIKYDKQTGALVTYKIINNEIYIASFSIESQDTYQLLYEKLFYKQLDK